jgi:formylglycine-generating enzyme required for sulfatase activity
MPRIVLLMVLMLPIIVQAEADINQLIQAAEGGIPDAQYDKEVADAKHTAEAQQAIGKSLESVEPEMVSFGSFAMGKYEVTFEQYDRFARATGKTLPFDNGWGWGQQPVINVSWDEVVAYATWLSQQTGKRYRLPTEAEWERACGMQTAYCGGNDIDAVAWYEGNSGNQTQPVGQKRPNSKGLYDMSGNVWEWTSDCWEGDCRQRAMRGGSWFTPSALVHSADSLGGTTDARFESIGFRLAQDL